MKLDPRLFEELSMAYKEGLASGELMTPAKIEQQLSVFRERFGPAILHDLNGEALLLAMHGRDATQKSLAYWLEFKNDEEFSTRRFGSISGGSALKFRIFQRQSDDIWITGSSNAQEVLSTENAIAIAHTQRAELLAGLDALESLEIGDTSDDAYSRLQMRMELAAPTLFRDGWAHKYWFLLNSARLDDYHNPRYQRFHIFKLLQMPPDETGILDGRATRFNCSGRLIAAARELDIPVTSLNKLLNSRDGSIHRYWKVGTTNEKDGGSFWQSMRDGGFVAINWSVPDLSSTIGLDKDIAKNQIREWLLPDVTANSEASRKSIASRKSGEIYNFAVGIEENDTVLACQGQRVLGVGKVRGSYEFAAGPEVLHKRAVEWLLLEPWNLPDSEGPYTSVFQLGRSATNLLEIEKRLFNRDPAQYSAITIESQSASLLLPLPPLEPFAARAESVLRRKGQVIFYGPPGTGKTYRALSVAKELATRYAFGKREADLSVAERAILTDQDGLVRVCTFHPGWGYEDFIEGLRPSVIAERMMFEIRDGIFKRLCGDAVKQPNRNFYLIIDEINRGDLPRIFGELITTIELDKRRQPIRLPISGSSFSVPPNVYLIGTMNTADRSISLIDLALRRRFGFLELMPDSTLVSGRSVGGLQLGPWLDALNERLRKYLKRDARNLQIGHAYLMPAQPIISIADFSRVLRDDIIPLLEEYCYDDFATLKEILGPDLVDDEAGRIREELFDVKREAELIEAVSFEEMRPFLLSQPAIEEPLEIGPLDTTAVMSEDETDSLSIFS